ncbi:hypothetical protein Tco_1330303 [Tanacetum coccineum]
MTTMAEHVVAAGVDNRPPMLNNSQYNSWKSRILPYIKGKEHGKDLYDSVINGPFQYGTVEVPETKTTLPIIRERTYDDLTDKEKILEACDIRATNIVLQGLPPNVYSLMNHHTVAKDIWDKVKLLIEGSEFSLQEENQSYMMSLIHSLQRKERRFTLNTKFLNHLQPEWSKFVTDVKLARDMHSTNFDQLYAHLRKHEAHANEVRLMRQRFPDPLALVANSYNSPSCYTNHSQYHQQLSLGYARSGGRSNATSTRVNKNVGTNIAGQAKALESRVVLDEEHMAFLADNGDTQPQLVQFLWLSFLLMIHTFSKSNVISYDQYLKETKNEVVQDTTSSSQQDAMIMYMIKEMSNQVAKCNEVNKENKTINESLTAELESHKTLSTTVDVLKKESKAKEDKYLDEIIDFEKKKKDLDNDAYVNKTSNKKYFKIEKKEFFIENDRLLEHIICQDVMCIAMHADLENKYVVPTNDNHLEYAKMEQSYIGGYSKVLELEVELSKKKDM